MTNERALNLLETLADMVSVAQENGHEVDQEWVLEQVSNLTQQLEGNEDDS